MLKIGLEKDRVKVIEIRSKVMNNEVKADVT
jgi:hypothetical protein